MMKSVKLYGKEIDKSPDGTAENVFLTVSMKLSNGHFESSISIPLQSTDEERKRFTDSWLTMMEAGLKCGSVK
jgi:hypothetical protein